MWQANQLSDKCHQVIFIWPSVVMSVLRHQVVSPHHNVGAIYYLLHLEPDVSEAAVSPSLFICNL